MYHSDAHENPVAALKPAELPLSRPPVVPRIIPMQAPRAVPDLVFGQVLQAFLIGALDGV